MSIVKIILLTLIAGYLCGFLIKTILAGFRTGSIAYIDSKRRCDRAGNPAGFWALVVFFGVLVVVVAATWVMAVLG